MSEVEWRSTMKVVMTKLAMCVAVALVSGLAVLPPALAEDRAPAKTDAATPAPAAPPTQEDVKQIKLTEDQVKNFIAAQPDLASIATKIQAAGDKPDPALQAELEGIATKHGFGNFAELDDVAANISIVMAG